MIPQQIIIPNTNDKYYVTIDGKVFNSLNGKELKQSEWRKALYVTMYYNSGEYTKSMSSIMRQTYFKGRKGILYHKNKISSDYSYWNLGIVPPNGKRVYLNSSRKPIVRLYKDEVEFFSSQKEAAKKYNKLNSSISHYIHHISKDPSGAIWMRDE